MTISNNNRVNDAFTHWISITQEPSFNSEDMERLYELAICVVEENVVLSENLFIKTVKEKFQISRTFHRGAAQKFFNQLSAFIQFYQYLTKK